MMRTSLHFPFHRGGFTLLEMVVVTGLLGTFLVLTTVVSKNALELNATTRARISADRNAAACFRQLSSDLGQRVVRRDVNLRIEKKEGNDAISLFTLRPGIAVADGTADRSVSMVSYRVEASRLERAANGFGFGEETGRPDLQTGTLVLLDLPSEGPEHAEKDRFQIIAPGVLRLEMSFLIEEQGTQVIKDIAPEDQSSIRGIIATVVTLDPARSRGLSDQELEKIASEFPDAKGSELPFSKWNETADALSRKLPSGRKAVLQQVRVHQRWIATHQPDNPT